MKQVIYIDILIAVNLFINYFVLIATASFLHLKIKTRRLIFSEALGAVYSLYIFLPETGTAVSAAVKLAMAITIVWAGFGRLGKKLFIKTFLCFFSINFAFSGIMFALWCTFKPRGMQVSNGVVYFDISPFVLIISTLLAYILIEFIGRIVGKRENKNTKCAISIMRKGLTETVFARVDTGNLLTEPFSGLPVIVVKNGVLKRTVPPEIDMLGLDNCNKDRVFNQIDAKMRFVPFKTISGEGLLPAFKPDQVCIESGPPKEAYVAVCSKNMMGEDTNALVGYEFIN